MQAGTGYFPHQMYQMGARYTAPPPQPAAPPIPQPPSEETLKIYMHLENLLKPELRDTAIVELSKCRESFQNLGPMVWYSAGAMAVLLQEIISVYPLLAAPQLLQGPVGNRVSSALALLQCVASHQATRKAFLDAQICVFLYPFLRATINEKAFEYLRLTSLGVIGALVKADDVEVIRYLLGTEIVPLCLKIMENGSELSKTVATFVLQRILFSDQGLAYVCQTPDRFTAVVSVLRCMVSQPDCSARLLRHIVRCYLRLTDNARARDALAQCLPEELRNGTHTQAIKSDEATKKWMLQLLVNIGDEGAKRVYENLVSNS